MKKHILFAAALLVGQMAFAAPKIQHVEPLNWWTEMQTPLTIMFHGEDLQDAQVSVQQVTNGKVMRGECLGLIPRSQHNAESPNYLFVDFGVFKPGVYRITLKKGSKGAYVTKAQTALAQRGYDLGKWGIDGDFGSATEKAVKQFQKDWGLPETGVADQITMDKLNSVPKPKQYSITIYGLSRTDSEDISKKYSAYTSEIKEMDEK